MENTILEVLFPKGSTRLSAHECMGQVSCGAPDVIHDMLLVSVRVCFRLRPWGGLTSRVFGHGGECQKATEVDSSA